MEWTSINLPTPTLHMGIGNTLFSKQISKLYFQSSIQVHSLLDKTEGQRKAFFGGCKKEVGGGRGVHCERATRNIWLSKEMEKPIIL